MDCHLRVGAHWGYRCILSLRCDSVDPGFVSQWCRCRGPGRGPGHGAGRCGGVCSVVGSVCVAAFLGPGALMSCTSSGQTFRSAESTGKPTDIETA